MRGFSQYKSRLLGVACATAMLATPAIGIAATATTTFQVTATVLSVCTVSATNLAFGNYDASSGTPNDASSTVTTTCSNTTPYTVALNAGTGSGATVALRRMTNGANTLSYTMYTTAGRTTVWGDGTLSTVTQAGTGNGSGQALTVFGRVPTGQYVTAGSYTDTVTATVTY
ncbi:MAG: spore coat U domain-containing protein [Alphaproteobacteria bacterium]|nr:spore coat U domain-containing protein [Alphaproteobacteria bacterium]